jgi:ribonuclease VapC
VILDTSAVYSIVLGEEDASRNLVAIRNALVCRMSTATYFETGIVIDGTMDKAAQLGLDRLIQSLGIILEPVTANQTRLARQAYRAYGKGSGHPAKLNFGDCFAYALAIDFDEPLLFKGNDFIHTDVRVATKPAT